MDSREGFREQAHTADCELEVWSPSLPGLLRQAVLGMNCLCGLRLQAEPRQERTLSVQGMDAESLLVRFLSEVLWLMEDERLGFDTFELLLSNQGDVPDKQHPLRLEVRMQGALIAELDKEIKAVTYHNLAVRQTRNGLRVRIVFDV